MIVENEDHCDFQKLRQLLIRTHMLDLISSTEESHYENYRNSQMETRKIGEAKYGRPLLSSACLIFVTTTANETDRYLPLSLSLLVGSRLSPTPSGRKRRRLFASASRSRSDWRRTDSDHGSSR
jgi:septin family protein